MLTCDDVQRDDGPDIQGKLEQVRWYIYLAPFMREFLQARGSAQATVFAFPDGTQVMCMEFDAALRQLQSFAASK